jgi:hypothetical protein
MISWMGRARGLRGPQKHSKSCQTSLFCYRGKPHHSSQQDRLDGPSQWAPWAPETFKNPVKPLYFVSDSSHIIPASMISWMGRARGLRGTQKHSKSLSNLFILFQRPATSFQPPGSVEWAEPLGAMGPRNIQNPCQTSFFCFRGQPHHSIQQDRMDGPSPWVVRAPETFKTPVKTLYFGSEASHIIPASRIGWMGRARGCLGPQKLLKNLSNLFIVSEASHIIPASRISWMGRARGRRGSQNIQKPVRLFLFQRPATSFQPAGSVG